MPEVASGWSMSGVWKTLGEVATAAAGWCSEGNGWSSTSPILISMAMFIAFAKFHVAINEEVKLGVWRKAESCSSSSGREGADEVASRTWILTQSIHSHRT